MKVCQLLIGHTLPDVGGWENADEPPSLHSLLICLPHNSRLPIKLPKGASVLMKQTSKNLYAPIFQELDEISQL